MNQTSDASRFEFETEWIRGYARCYGCDVLYDETDLRRQRLFLVDILNIFREGFVVYGDKLEARGARWRIEGPTDDGRLFHVDVTVISEIYYVEIERITKEKGRSDERYSAA